VVEDNDINQQVARELLEDMGFVVEIAADGKLALDMVQRYDYELVLMDMQMPIMDGLTATQEIRKIERLAHLPIIAMTANAMEKDRQRCIESGMSDVVIKPIDPEVLWKTLARWLGGKGTTDGPGCLPVNIAQKAVMGVHNLPQDIPGLDTSLGLRRMIGKRPLYIAMLGRYVAGQRQVCTQIREALAAGDAAAAERLAHTTKGVSGNVGATSIEKLAGALEQSLREHNPALEIQRRLDRLEGPLSDLITALESQLPCNAELNGASVPAGGLRHVSPKQPLSWSST
jgi:CheY-like chemotaxis protein